MEEMREILEEGTPEERRAFLRGFIKEVRVKGDEVTLHYTCP
jgi:hypothetical protein